MRRAVIASLLFTACSDAPRGALDTCLTALQGEVSPSGDFPAWVQACGPLYVHPTCRAALEEAAKLPAEERTATMLRGCALAHCGTLPGGKPRACDLPTDASPAELRGAWQELEARMHEHELGWIDAGRLAQAQFEAQRRTRVRDVRPPSERGVAAARAPIEGFSIRLSPGEGRFVRVQLSHRAEPLAFEPSQARLMLPEALRDAPKGPRVTLEATNEVPYDALLAISDALRTHGYPEVVLLAE